MKSKLLLTLASIAVMLAGCNQEEVGGLNNSPTTTKSFTVNVDDGVNTRTVTPPAEAPTRYVMELYKGTSAASGTLVSHTEQATGVFSEVVLDNGGQYVALFWADYGTPTADNDTPATSNEYDAADLKAAKVVASKQAKKAAFAGMSQFTVGTTNEDVYTAVTLSHAVAMVNFVQTEALTAASNTLTVSFPESYKLNVEDNVVTKIDGTVTYTFDNIGKVTANTTIGTGYIIAATGGSKTVMEITATLNTETAKVVSNVPFERNFKTNISGAYSSKYAATLTVTCDDVWGTPDNEAEIPEVKRYSIGDLFPDDNNPKGIVCSISDGGLHGKAFSTDENRYLAWATGSAATTEIGANDQNSGAVNMATIQATGTDWETNYPAFKWCADHAPINGHSWYLPAVEEIKLLAANYQQLKAIADVYFSSPGLGGYWYASSEYTASPSENVHCVTVSTGILYSSEVPKTMANGSMRVRAMIDF